MRNRCIASRMHPTVVSRSRSQQLGFYFSAFLLRFLALPYQNQQATPIRPISRPSAGVVEGVERQGCRESREGHGWPFVACPWNGTGAREPRRSRGRMQGQAFLLTFFATEKSEAPCKAQSVVRAEESAASKTPDREAKKQKLRPQAGSYGASQHSAPCKAQSVVRAEESAASETPDPPSQKTKASPASRLLRRTPALRAVQGAIGSPGPRQVWRPKPQIMKPKNKSFARKRAPTAHPSIRAVQGAT